jgi:hypothetical protein
MAGQPGTQKFNRRVEISKRKRSEDGNTLLNNWVNELKGKMDCAVAPPQMLQIATTRKCHGRCGPGKVG